MANLGDPIPIRLPLSLVSSDVTKIARDYVLSSREMNESCGMKKSKKEAATGRFSFKKNN